MSKVILDMSNINLSGDVIEISSNNYNIIYNNYKKNNKNYEIEYIFNKNKRELLTNNSYDICIVFFTLKDIFLKHSKKNIINKIYDILRDNGKLYIWDINKQYFKIANNNIDLVISQSVIKSIKVKSYNIFMDNSCNTIIKIIKQKFNIVNVECRDGIFFIIAQKGE